MFTAIFIPDKHTHELQIYENPMSKKLNFFPFIDFLCFHKIARKSGIKTIHHEPVHVG